METRGVKYLLRPYASKRARTTYFDTAGFTRGLQKKCGDHDIYRYELPIAFWFMDFIFMRVPFFFFFKG